MNLSLLRLAKPLAFGLGAALTLLAFSSFVHAARTVFADPALVLPDETRWTAAQLEAALSSLGLPANFYAVYTLGIALVFNLAFLVCGWLILLRRSQDWFGLYLALLLLAWGNGTGVFTPTPAATPGIGQDVLAWFMWPGLFLLMYFFPSGQVTPRWARWFAWTWMAFCVYGLSTDLLGRLPEFTFALPLIFSVLLVGVYAQAYRYRHAGALERQQIKLVVFALVLMAAYFMVFSILINSTGLTDPGQSGLTGAFLIHLVFFLTANLVFMGIPISMTVAILRYRLWDINLIIRRTLVYSTLTALLALVYFGLVVVLQGIFGNLSNLENSPLAVVISTLVIAALFNPLRLHLQDFIDRRFFRQKYNSQLIMEHFALETRSETDLDRLNSKLLQVLRDTYHPAWINFWINEDRK